MKKIIFNATGEIRNGWWIVIFLGFVVLTQFIYKPITHGLRSLSVIQEIVDLTSVFLVLLCTFACLKLRKQSMANVGLAFESRWFKEFSLGILAGGLWLLSVALLLWLVGGVNFSLDPQRSISLVSLGLYTFFLGALLEEILHRGFIFQRLIDGMGFWPAQLVIALIFAFGHLGNPEMDGLTVVRASIDLVLASLIFGLAYWRTKSLALPVGLHLGWNWFQGSIMGFNVSGHEHSGWFKAQLTDLPEWVSGGKFGLEGGIFSILVSLILLVILYRWKLTKPEIDDSRSSALKPSAV